MKTIGQLVLILIFINLNKVNAQDFTFRYNMDELEDVENEIDIKDHFLGEDIAKKFQLLKERYTYIVVNELSYTESTVIEKSSIYNSVKKMSKYLKKEIKKGNITEDEAKTQLDNALNIAINIRYQDTEEFESMLWKVKSPDKLATIYKDQVKLEM